MPYIEPEVIREAKKMDLLSYLQHYEPQELVHVSGNIYCTRSHDSLRISNGKWCWFSQGIGGRSALDYLIKVEGCSFTEAVEKIMGRGCRLFFAPATPQEKPKTLLLPKANRCATHAVSYLKQRGISDELIEHCIRTGRLYESCAPYYNLVFVGFDKQGAAKYASIRGIGTDFKGDCNGSDKRYSFSLPAACRSDTLHLFEGAIDLLSYATLCKDWRRQNLLSLAGVYTPRKNPAESKIPAALARFLEDYPHIQTIFLHLDNDIPGRLAARAIMAVLPEKYTVIDRPPPSGKDCNDYLLHRLRQRKEKQIER